MGTFPRDALPNPPTSFPRSRDIRVRRSIESRQTRPPKCGTAPIDVCQPRPIEEALTSRLWADDTPTHQSVIGTFNGIGSLSLEDGTLSLKGALGTRAAITRSFSNRASLAIHKDMYLGAPDSPSLSHSHRFAIQGLLAPCLVLSLGRCDSHHL